jgi:RimJ/RimL family protein N-acetyltransferase
MEPISIETETIRLRPHREDDLERIVEAVTDPDFVRHTHVPESYTRRDAESFLERCRASWAEQPPTAVKFAVADAETDVYLGNIALHLERSGHAEVTFGLHPDARGRGVMSAALRTLADWAFSPVVEEEDGLGLEVLEWRAHAGNWGSRRVAWACGFRVEGKVRGLCGVTRGRVQESWIGTLLRTDQRVPGNRWFDVPRLVGERCVLRDWRDEDAAAMAEARNDAATQRWLPVGHPPLDAERSLRRIQMYREQHANGSFLNFAVADPATDAWIGEVRLMHVGAEADGAEVGYAIHPAARGKGVGTEAVRMAVAHGFARPAPGGGESGGLGLHRISLDAAPANAASRGLAKRCGFTEVGLKRRAYHLGDGSVTDLICYDALAEER